MALYETLKLYLKKKPDNQFEALLTILKLLSIL